MGQDKNVSDLSKLLGFTQSTVSHQLNLLKANKMIRRYKDGKKVFYALVDKNVSKVIEEDIFRGLQAIRPKHVYRYFRFVPKDLR